MSIGAYVGRIWLNGEFGLSRERKINLDRTVLRTDSEELRWRKAMLKLHGIEKCLEFRREQDSSPEIPLFISGERVDWAEVEKPPSTLGSSLVANSHRAARGQSGISRYGSKLVRNGSYLLQREVQLSRISFLTLTLPNVSRAESETICENWSEVVRVFVQRLRRTLRRGGLPGEIVGCTEVQEGRAQLTGVFGLHLHMLFVGRGRLKSWCVTPSEVKDMWKSALEPYLSSPVGGYDWRAVENIEPLRSGKTEYLGKYMSKGLKSCQKLKALFPGIKLPSAWYMCTNSLRDRVKAGTLRVSGDLGGVVVEMLESMGDSWVKYMSPVKLKVVKGEIAIGYVGRMTKRGRSELAVYIESSRVPDEGASLLIVNLDMKEG